MKKMTVFLTVLIILSQISTCSFAFEATDDEQFAYEFASEFLQKYYSNVYLSTKFDIFEDTFARLDDSEKNEILEKAKEYEDEIRDNHHYRFYADRKDYQPDELENLPPADPNKRPVCKAYDNTAIEDVITSFPIFFEKKMRYKNGVHVSDYSDTPDYICNIYPKRTIVSESGFAYVHAVCVISFDYSDGESDLFNSYDCDILLYKFAGRDMFAERVWAVCDVSSYFEQSDELHRFKYEDWDVEKELSEFAQVNAPSTESENTDINTESKTYRAVESENKSQDSPNESKPINYIPWVICGIGVVAVIALAVAFVLKKKK